MNSLLKYIICFFKVFFITWLIIIGGIILSFLILLLFTWSSETFISVFSSYPIISYVKVINGVSVIFGLLYSFGENA